MARGTLDGLVHRGVMAVRAWRRTGSVRVALGVPWSPNGLEDRVPGGPAVGRAVRRIRLAASAATMRTDRDRRRAAAAVGRGAASGEVPVTGGGPVVVVSVGAASGGSAGGSSGSARRSTPTVEVLAARTIMARPAPGVTTDRPDAGRAATTGGASGPGGADAATGPIATDPVAIAVGVAPVEPASGAAPEVVVLLAATTSPFDDDGWEGVVDRLVRPLTAGAAAIASVPLAVHPDRHGLDATPDDLLVRDAGASVRLDAEGRPRLVVERGARSPVVARCEPDHPAPLAGGSALAVRWTDYLAAGGLGPLGDPAAALVDLSVRLRATGRPIVAVPSAVVVDGRPVRSRAALDQAIDRRAPGWSDLVLRHGPLLVRRGSTGTVSPRLVLSTAVPTEKVWERWGDWPFARAMADALGRHGVDALVHSRDHHHDPAGIVADVRLVVRGLVPFARTGPQAHVLWIMSHPEDVAVAELDDADLVAVASTRHAEALRSVTTTPVAPLLQATDPRRFHHVPAVPAHSHPVAVVARSRDVARAVVLDAVAAGLRPAIYGSGWNGIVDPALVVADHVGNDELAAVYSSVGVLLNDHWAGMKEHGFVSNRIFDALACGTPVVSDHLPEIAELFGDAVPTYSTPEDLATTVAGLLADPAAARARAAAGQAEVLAHHTFDHRAAELLALLRDLGLLPPSGGDTGRSQGA